MHPSVALDHFTIRQYSPGPSLDRFVDHFWATAWDLPAPFDQTIVTFPAVNLVFQADGSAMVSGVKTENDERHLEGSGWAFGVLFRAGGFRPLVDRPMASLVDEVVPAESLFGPDVRELADAVVAIAADQEVADSRRLTLITKFLQHLVPGQETPGEAISQLVESAVRGAEPVTRVSELAARHHVSVRTLQRLFAEHVGIGPKQVLDRHRVHAAAELARTGIRSWADVAHRLGYADQAHLTADVSTTYGTPPAAYAKAEASPAIEADPDH